MTIRQQAQLFSAATVVVHVHGAALGNYVFLPRGATVVHLAPVEHKWSPSFSIKLVRLRLCVGGLVGGLVGGRGWVGVCVCVGMCVFVGGWGWACGTSGGGRAGGQGT